MTVLGRSAQRHATGTARRSRTRLAAVFAGLAAALGVLGMPGAAVAVVPSVTINGPDSGTPGQQLTFTADVAPDAALGELSYVWSCGSGTGPSTTCSFFGHGPHNVSVTVTDSSDGATGGDNHIVTISNVAPLVSIDNAPTSVHVGTPFTLTASSSDPNGDAFTLTWRLDGNVIPSSGGSATLALPSTGSHTVSVTATETVSGLTRTDSTSITGANQAPKAAIAITTPSPIAVGATGATVAFDASASTDADGDPLSYEWDWGDGTPNEITTLPTKTHNYLTADTFIASVTVRDGRGGVTLPKTILVRVVPSPLTASFTYAPIAPGVGQAITLTSTSVGPDSPITSQTWDLDNDGQFDDASGPTAQWSFGAAGSYQVSLKVTNANGVSSASFQTINVTGPATAQSPASSASTTPQGTPSLRRMSPFPIVRLRGTLRGGVARITLLTVKAPKGAKIRVLCKGRSCPYARKASTARFTTRALRFRSMERRLRPGTVITVMVTKSKRIGKYTRFTIRSGAAPRRLDRCLAPGSFKPVKCSSLR